MLALKEKIRVWGRELGFAAIGFGRGELPDDVAAGLSAWVEAGFHGEMDYMAAHYPLRTDPTALLPGTQSIIGVRMNYTPECVATQEILQQPDRAFISRYALGRDYHKLMRTRLQKLADRIEKEVGPFAYRAFADSAPVMEVELAQRSRLGWRGKHTLLLTREAGSYFFLGELFVSLPIPPDAPDAPAAEFGANHCGSCSACLRACPTGAIVAPYRLDARRCISYLTIELKGAIPLDMRPLLGNRIYGCDDCQLICPWNRFAQLSVEGDFAPRNGLDSASLLELFAWEADEFERRLAGSPVRRIGHERWLRNIAVALGNALAAGAASTVSAAILQGLRERAAHPSALVREHVRWALQQHPEAFNQGA